MLVYRLVLQRTLYLLIIEMVNISLSKLLTWNLVLLSLIRCTRPSLIPSLLIVIIGCLLLARGLLFLCFLLFSTHLYLFSWSFSSLLNHNLFIAFQFRLLFMLKRRVISQLIGFKTLLLLGLLLILLKWLFLHVLLEVLILYFVVLEVITFIL